MDDLQLMLLQGGTWRYLRYLHFRDYLARIADEIETVCVCGAGYGLAELACAIEFPHIRFMLTDIIAKGYPNYHRAMDIAWKRGVDNVAFSTWNVLSRTHRRFDLVASTEMLEHVPNLATAARNMREAATKYVYCLVPFSDEETNLNPSKRAAAWERHGHFVYGFDRSSLESLFGEATLISGAYWSDFGLLLRQKLQAMTPEQIAAIQSQLVTEATNDLRDAVPTKLDEAAGIKILAKADARVPSNPILAPRLEELEQVAHQ